MLSVGALSFAAPWLLAALAGLPVLWWLLRLIPPAPRRQIFPAIRLLLDLVPREETPERTPPWLLALRLLLAALVILGLARPIFDAPPRFAGDGPLVLVVDDGWAAAVDWPARVEAMNALIAQAERENLPVLVLPTAAPDDGGPIAAGDLAPAGAARDLVGARPPQPGGPARPAPAPPPRGGAGGGGGGGPARGGGAPPPRGGPAPAPPRPPPSARCRRAAPMSTGSATASPATPMAIAPWSTRCSGSAGCRCWRRRARRCRCCCARRRPRPTAWW